MSGQKHSCGFLGRKLRCKKKLDFVTRKIPVLLCDVVAWPRIELESVMTAEISDVNNSHLRAEDRCGSLHIGCHRGAGRRKVDAEQNLLHHLIMVPAPRWVLPL